MHDCVSFGTRMADVISDSDYAALKAGTNWYDSKDVAKLLHGTDLTTLISIVLGSPMDRRFVQHGDLMIATDSTGQQVLTVHDGQQLLAADLVGYKTVPVSAGRHGWRII